MTVSAEVNIKLRCFYQRAWYFKVPSSLFLWWSELVRQIVRHITFKLWRIHRCAWGWRFSDAIHVYAIFNNDHVRSTTGVNVFSRICLSVHKGTYPIGTVRQSSSPFPPPALTGGRMNGGGALSIRPLLEALHNSLLSFNTVRLSHYHSVYQVRHIAKQFISEGL